MMGAIDTVSSTMAGIGLWALPENVDGRNRQSQLFSRQFLRRARVEQGCLAPGASPSGPGLHDPYEPGGRAADWSRAVVRHYCATSLRSKAKWQNTPLRVVSARYRFGPSERAPILRGHRRKCRECSDPARAVDLRSLAGAPTQSLRDGVLLRSNTDFGRDVAELRFVASIEMGGRQPRPFRNPRGGWSQIFRPSTGRRIGWARRSSRSRISGR